MRLCMLSALSRISIAENMRTMSVHFFMQALALGYFFNPLDVVFIRNEARRPQMQNKMN